MEILVGPKADAVMVTEPLSSIVPTFRTEILALPPRASPAWPFVPVSATALADTVIVGDVTVPPVTVRLAVPPWLSPVTVAGWLSEVICSRLPVDSVPPLTFTATLPAAPTAPSDRTTRLPVAPPC